MRRAAFQVLPAILTVAVASMRCGAAPLSLDDCIRLAMNAPSSVVAARQQMLIAKYGITAARAGFFPQLSIANAYTYNSPLKATRTLLVLPQRGRKVS